MIKIEPKPAHVSDETWNRYEIYFYSAVDLGWHIKTFDEWLNS